MVQVTITHYFILSYFISLIMTPSCGCVLWCNTSNCMLMRKLVICGSVRVGLAHSNLVIAFSLPVGSGLKYMQSTAYDLLTRSGRT